MSVYPSARSLLHILFIWYTEDDFLGIELKGNAPLKAKFPQNQNLIIHFALLNSRETSGPRKSESIKKGDQELSQHEDWTEKLKICLFLGVSRRYYSCQPYWTYQTTDILNQTACKSFHIWKDPADDFVNIFCHYYVETFIVTFVNDIDKVDLDLDYSLKDLIAI